MLTMLHLDGLWKALQGSSHLGSSPWVSLEVLTELPFILLAFIGNRHKKWPASALFVKLLTDTNRYGAQCPFCRSPSERFLSEFRTTGFEI